MKASSVFGYAFCIEMPNSLSAPESLQNLIDFGRLLWRS